MTDFTLQLAERLLLASEALGAAALRRGEEEFAARVAAYCEAMRSMMKPLTETNAMLDTGVKFVNDLIDTITELTKAVADRDEQIASLRRALAMAEGGEDFEVAKRHALATTGTPEFLYTGAE